MPTCSRFPGPTTTDLLGRAAAHRRLHGGELRGRRRARPGPRAAAAEPVGPAARRSPPSTPSCSRTSRCWRSSSSPTSAWPRSASGWTCSRPARSAWSSSTPPTCPRSSGPRSPACTPDRPRRARRSAWAGSARFGHVVFPQALRLGAARHQHHAGGPAEVHLAAGHHLRGRADVRGAAHHLATRSARWRSTSSSRPSTSRSATRCPRCCSGWNGGSARACR